MIKRCFDFFCALIGLIILSPLLLVISFLVFAVDFGSPFFLQERVGRMGRHFRMLKFRTMVQNADRMGPAITVIMDPRITWIGHFLRKTKLDELPQLWNVVMGEMSLVGPRPEVPIYVSLYTLEQRRVLNYRPGITDPASFEYFNEQEILGGVENPDEYYVQVIMPDKIRINLQYQKTATFLSDLRIILATIFKIFR